MTGYVQTNFLRCHNVSTLVGNTENILIDEQTAYNAILRIYLFIIYIPTDWFTTIYSLSFDLHVSVPERISFIQNTSLRNQLKNKHKYE